MIRPRSFVSMLALHHLFKSFAARDHAAFMELTPSVGECPHPSINIDNSTIVFGKPVMGVCRRCKARVPMRAMVLLTSAPEPKNNGPWEVSTDGVWTRPAETPGTVEVV